MFVCVCRHVVCIYIYMMIQVAYVMTNDTQTYIYKHTCMYIKTYKHT